MKTKKKPTRTAVVKATKSAPVRWEPDRAWHSGQRKTYALLDNLRRMQTPIEIAANPSEDARILFARNSEGKELFFLDDPKLHHPGERDISNISRNEALAIACIWALPYCLLRVALRAFKKSRAW